MYPPLLVLCANTRCQHTGINYKTLCLKRFDLLP